MDPFSFVAARIEEQGRMVGARPDFVSDRAKERQRREMGTLGSGNHYLEVQAVAEIFDTAVADAFGLAQDSVVVTVHCGSRGLGHQIGTEFLKEMVVTAKGAGIDLPDRELACAPINSEVGQRYLGAMRAAINCSLANREILGHYVRRVFAHFFPDNRMQPDARIINLETAITRSGDYARKGINYRMSPENADCLSAAGIDCCVLANNHVLDWGRNGLLEKLTALEHLNIKAAGAGRNVLKAAAPAVLELAGKPRVLVFSFGVVTSGIPRS